VCEWGARYASGSWRGEFAPMKSDVDDVRFWCVNGGPSNGCEIFVKDTIPEVVNSV